jgi:hypothetical protein
MTLHRIKHAALAAFAAFALLASAHAATIASFSDIQYWVGSGPNQAGLVIDWNDATGTHSYAWGYRWTGTATGEDMIKAIAGYIGTSASQTTTADGTGDTTLSLYTVFFSGFGDAVYELTYQNGSGPHSEGGFDSDTAGYWAYYVADGSANLPAWNSSNFASVGMGSRTLANNSWDAWVWEPNFGSDLPATPIAASIAPVPEPATIALFSLGGLALLVRRRSPHAR